MALTSALLRALSSWNFLSRSIRSLPAAAILLAVLKLDGLLAILWGAAAVAVEEEGASAIPALPLFMARSLCNFLALFSTRRRWSRDAAVPLAAAGFSITDRICPAFLFVVVDGCCCCCGDGT